MGRWHYGKRLVLQHAWRDTRSPDARFPTGDNRPGDADGPVVVISHASGSGALAGPLTPLAARCRSTASRSPSSA